MKNIKTTICIAVALLAGAVQGFADQRSDAVLARLASAIGAMGRYRVAFEVRAEGNTVEGTYVVSGERYCLETEDYTIIGDGRARYEIGHQYEEVMIDRADPADRNILSNPTHAFDFLSADYDSRWAGERGGADLVVLTPRDGSGTVRSITLAVGREGGLPESIAYAAEGLTEDIVVRIRSIVPDPGGSDALLRFDRAKYPGYEVVDFR